MGFVKLTKQEFEAILPGDAFIADVPDALEVVYDIPTENTGINVRIYSTVDKRTQITREKGKDAIRVVFWDIPNDRPMGKGKKILRVDGATTIQDRIHSRIQEFMADAGKQQIIDFNYVKAVLSANSRSKFAQSLLEQVNQRGILSDGQMAYVLGETSPKGYPTLEANVKSRNPEFVQDYLDGLEEASDMDKETDQLINEAIVQRDKELAGIKSQLKPVDGNNVVLIPTTDYQDWKYPFENFNPVQSLVYPLRHHDRNMIIGANTSAGKTICAELLMDFVLANDQRIIYLSPLKSLTQEKYEDWQKRFPNEKITIMTGDYVLSEAMKKQITGSRIIVMTSEMMDSRTRKYKAEKNYWMGQVGLVIVDESHILSTNRGHAVETGIMRFTRLNFNARVLFLSATMPNVDELGHWLTTLNKKDTDVIYCNWRPVVLQMHYHEYTPARSSWGGQDYHATQVIKRRMAVDIVKSKPDEKFLVFVHDKATGRDMVRRLKNHDVNASFHSADLKMDERLSIEKSFQDKGKGLRVIVSTSTLAWGAVNEETEILMANGTKKLAKDVKAGNAICSYNEKTGKFEQDVVLNALEYEPEYDLEIELENGQTIRVDKKHPFYVRQDDGSFITKEAANLTEMDDLVIL